MKIISPTFVGNLVICSECGALLSWENDHDVYDGDIYCPICKAKTHIDYDKNYNGIIKEEVKKDNE